MRQHALKAHGENVLKARNNTQRLAAACNAVDDAPRVRRCRTRARTARAAR
jgi:hypothetical protein